MRIVLVRHGETDSNRGRLALGQEDVPLNNLGLQQAARVASRLAEDIERGVRFEAVYVSPLRRARETAQAVVKAIGAPLIEAPELIEMNVGDMDGLTPAELSERYPDFLRHWRGPAAGEIKMPGGGESLADVQARAWPLIERLRDEHPPEAALVAVSHNFVIRTVICKALGIELADFRRFEQDLAAITRLEFRGPRILVTVLNETCHLDGLQS